MKKLLLAGICIFIGWAAAEWYEAFSHLAHFGEEADVKKNPFRREAAVGFPAPSLQGVPKARDTAAVPFSPTTIEIPKSAMRAPTQAADRFLSEHREQWNIQDYHELRPSVIPSPAGSVVHYQVYQEGVPILGMSVTLKVDSNNEVTVTQAGYLPVRQVDMTQPSLTQDEILQRYAAQYTLDETSTAGAARVIYIPPGSTEAELAWVLPVRDSGENGQSARIVFRASDGGVLGRNPEQAPSRF